MTLRNRMARLLVSATRKSSGKTLLTLGMCAALRHRDVTVQPFKKGPDYIDPLWLTAAAGRNCLNLDFYTMEPNEILSRYGDYSQSADVSLVEGNKGLYDGMDLYGSDSNAALAKLLQLPILLVVDVAGMTRGVAPVIMGYQAFESGLEFAGVVLNNYQGQRHLGKLQTAIETYTDCPVLGAIPRSTDVHISERHLGLITQSETVDATHRLNRLGSLTRDCVDIDVLVDKMSKAPVLELPEPGDLPDQAGRNIRIGIARDSAFCFYYSDDLDEMRRQGAELKFFEPLSDRRLPDVDALFIGGGFPETHAKSLEHNGEMRMAIRQFIVRGAPVYAECGGLMYLARALTWEDRRYVMVGAIPAEVIMEKHPVGRGYVVMERTQEHPWVTNGGEIRAHEFHYSRLTGLNDSCPFGLQMRRGHGIDGAYDGLTLDNLFVTYTHMRHTRQNPWVTDFLRWVRKIMNRDWRTSTRGVMAT